jgi:hypothetical protein
LRRVLITIQTSQVTLGECAKWSLCSVAISRPSLFNVLVFLRFDLQFLNHLLVLYFDLGLAFGLFGIELSDWRSVHRATHCFVLLYDCCLMDLLTKFRGHERVSITGVWPSLKSWWQ